MKIFCSTRPEMDLSQSLNDYPGISTNGDHKQKDMAIFVRDRLERNRHWLKHDFKETVASTLVQRSQDMFLFASLQIDSLLECEFEEDMEERLRDFPQTLTKAYENIYTEAITDREGKRKSGTKRFLDRALRWVLCSARPLTTDELLLAISQDSRSNLVAPQHPQLTKDWISARCRNLLTLDLKGYSDDGEVHYGDNDEVHYGEDDEVYYDDNCRPVWRLAHQAVAEFIEKGSEGIGKGPRFFGEDTDFSPEFSHFEAGKVCLMILNDLFGGSPSEVVVGSYGGPGPSEDFECPCKDDGDENSDHRRVEKPLAEYAIMAWPTHVRAHERCESTSNDGLSQPLKRFLCGEDDIGPAYARWLEHTCYRFSPLSDSKCWAPTWSIFATRSLPDVYVATMTPITLACHLGFQTILREWLHSSGSEKIARYESEHWLPIGDQYIRTHGSLKWSIVALASVHGEAGILELVLGRVPLINTTDEDAVPPIVAAAIGDSVQAAEMLLKRCNDLDSVFTRKHGHVLIFAIRSDSLKIMRLLLDKVLIEPQEVEKILASAQYGYFESPDAIIMLLEHGVDANASLKGGSLLMQAACHQWEELVCLLLEKGADVNKQFPGTYPGNALQDCVYTAETLSIPRLLTRHGARVGGAAVSYALRRGRRGLSRLLLESKPDLDETWLESIDLSHCGTVMTALIREVVHGNVENVQLLIRHGADVNLRVGGKCDDALNTVSTTLLGREGTRWNGRKEYPTDQMIEVLLQAGADLENRKGDRLNRLLAAAAHSGLEELVQNFLNRGADPNAFCEHKYVTALAAAVASEHPRALHFVRMLLENGANVNVYIPEPHEPIRFLDIGSCIRLVLDLPLGFVINPSSFGKFADRIQRMNAALEMASYLISEGAIWDIDFEQWRECCKIRAPDFYGQNSESLKQIMEGLSRNRVIFFQNNPGAASDERWTIKVADGTNFYRRNLFSRMHSCHQLCGLNEVSLSRFGA